MTRQLAFSVNKEIFRITIINKDIWYSDRIWKNAVRLIPKDENFIRKIRMSRGAIPKAIEELFTLTKKEQEEYDNANTEDELAEICIKDVRKNGAVLIQNKKTEDNPKEENDS